MIVEASKRSEAGVRHEISALRWESDFNFKNLDLLKDRYKSLLIILAIDSRVQKGSKPKLVSPRRLVKRGQCPLKITDRSKAS